jgi:hypothetical protein
MPRFAASRIEELYKLDLRETDGLTGVIDSLSYRVHEAERHLHSGGRWLELAAVPNLPTHAADRIGTTVIAPNPFRIDAGNNAWGAWVQILGSTDTPVQVGRVFFDPHQIIVNDTERAAEYYIQIGRGASGADAIANGTYTEFLFNATVQKETGIIELQTGRAPSGSLLWARCLSPGQNTAWFDFFMGIHEYEG